MLGTCLLCSSFLLCTEGSEGTEKHDTHLYKYMIFKKKISQSKSHHWPGKVTQIFITNDDL